MSTAKPMSSDRRNGNYKRQNGQARRWTPAQSRRWNRKLARNETGWRVDTEDMTESKGHPTRSRRQALVDRWLAAGSPDPCTGCGTVKHVDRRSGYCRGCTETGLYQDQVRQQ